MTPAASIYDIKEGNEYPVITFADLYDAREYNGDDYTYTEDEIIEFDTAFRKHYLPYILRILKTIKRSEVQFGLFPTDETPSDDEIPHHFHFSSHILLWYTLHRLQDEFLDIVHKDKIPKLIEKIEKAIPKYFITDHKGNHHLYHDATLGFL